MRIHNVVLLPILWLVSGGIAHAQSLTLDPAFMSIVGDAACKVFLYDSTSCAVAPSKTAPTSAVALASSSPTCFSLTPGTYDLCKDKDALSKMEQRGGAREATAEFDYLTAGNTFKCQVHVQVRKDEGSAAVLWHGSVSCHRELPEAAAWYATVYPNGSHLLARNGGFEMAILCRRGELSMTYFADYGAVTVLSIPESAKVEIGFSANAPTEPPPYDTMLPATAEGMAMFTTGGVDIMQVVSGSVAARRYVDVGVVLDDAPLFNVQFPARGSTKAATTFLEGCVT